MRMRATTSGIFRPNPKSYVHDCYRISVHSHTRMENEMKTLATPERIESFVCIDAAVHLCAAARLFAPKLTLILMECFYMAESFCAWISPFSPYPKWIELYVHEFEELQKFTWFLKVRLWKEVIIEMQIMCESVCVCGFKSLIYDDSLIIREPSGQRKEHPHMQDKVLTSLLRFKKCLLWRSVL